MHLPSIVPGKRFTLPRPTGSADALLIGRLAQARAAEKRLVAVVSADPGDAQRLADELPFFAPGLRVAVFPDWETLPWDTFSPHQDLISERLATLWKVLQRELDVVERHLNFLASVGSVSPYVGLVGTVWGIMHAFVGLSNLQQVTLATVAPGIAEALVATAIGLFAAIPAVIAYNRFSHDIDRIATQMETFMEEFTNILQRNAGASPATAGGAGGPR